MVVMDVTMPVLDGIEATRLIKATEGIRESSVIAYTGSASIPEALVERWFVAVVPKQSPADVRPRGGSERSESVAAILLVMWTRLMRLGLFMVERGEGTMRRK